MSVATILWRPRAIRLAAAVLLGASGVVPASAQSGPLAEKLQLCGACHGEDGNSKLEKIPSIAGHPAFYILNQLFLMREGVRKVEPMAPIVKDLKDDDLNALSQHYSQLERKRSDESLDPALVKRGQEIAEVKRCSSCHLRGLAGQDQMPRVARQRVDYLIATLKAYRDSPRPGADTAMSVPVGALSDADIKALSHYAASL